MGGVIAFVGTTDDGPPKYGCTRRAHEGKGSVPARWMPRRRRGLDRAWSRDAEPAGPCATSRAGRAARCRRALPRQLRFRDDFRALDFRAVERLPVLRFVDERFVDERFVDERFVDERFALPRFAVLRFAAPRFAVLRFAVLRFAVLRFRPVRFDGTFAPFSRASERPIAIACLRLVTRPPWPAFPRLSVPLFRRRIALSTDLPAPRPYLRPPDFFAAMSPPR
jgi:hypothetical protein